MCVVSMVGDEFSKRWHERDDWFKQINPYVPNPNPSITFDFAQRPTAAEVNALRKQVEELRKEVLIFKDLLKAAKLYDEKNNEPNCEMEEKMKLLKQVAKLFGIDIDDILKTEQK